MYLMRRLRLNRNQIQLNESDVPMKIVAALMVLIGVVLGRGAVAEFEYFGPDETPFWVGVFATPASAFFVLAGVLLWWRGQSMRRTALVAALIMAAATIAATILRVMGPPATLMGLIGAIVVVVWFWRTRAHVGPQIRGEPSGFTKRES